MNYIPETKHKSRDRGAALGPGQLGYHPGQPYNAIGLGGPGAFARGAPEEYMRNEGLFLPTIPERQVGSLLAPIDS
jgi:hypothetical protein